jgi:predicted nuclease of predicted toxin-antitoxin system
MKETVKSSSIKKTNWLRIHTLTPEQKQQLIAQKLERAKQQFEARAKIPVLTA